MPWCADLHWLHKECELQRHCSKTRPNKGPCQVFRRRHQRWHVLLSRPLLLRCCGKQRPMKALAPSFSELPPVYCIESGHWHLPCCPTGLWPKQHHPGQLRSKVVTIHECPCLWPSRRCCHAETLRPKSRLSTGMGDFLLNRFLLGKAARLFPTWKGQNKTSPPNVVSFAWIICRVGLSLKARYKAFNRMQTRDALKLFAVPA